jgi:tRNA(Arg) A34 adenosine deaminase TadA
MFPDINLHLPDWISDFCERWSGSFASVDGRVEFVLALARENISRDGGGPFGAAVFDCERGVLVAPGVNLVVPASCSVAHAEMVAIMIAQQVMGTHNLGDKSLPKLELVSSTEPCAMCMGAVPWSGVPRLVCAARGEDAIAIGFDEGAKPPDWPGELTKRGLTVVRDVRRAEAAAVLQTYAETGGVIY